MTIRLVNCQFAYEWKSFKFSREICINFNYQVIRLGLTTFKTLTLRLWLKDIDSKISTLKLLFKVDWLRSANYFWLATGLQHRMTSERCPSRIQSLFYRLLFIDANRFKWISRFFMRLSTLMFEHRQWKASWSDVRKVGNLPILN